MDQRLAEVRDRLGPRPGGHATSPHSAVPACLYRIPEAMQLLSLSRSVIYEQIRAGRLKLVTQGRTRLIPAMAIAEYVDLLVREHRALRRGRRPVARRQGSDAQHPHAARSHVDLDGDPAANPADPAAHDGVAVGPSRWDTKTRKSRRTLALPERCIEALREQRKRQQTACTFAGDRWADNDLARLVGHAGGSAGTETVYPKQLRPIIDDGATVMSRVFPGRRDSPSVGPSARSRIDERPGPELH